MLLLWASGAFDGGPKAWEGQVSLLVLKFGGTSVADIERIRHVAALVKREVERGNKVAVVVSAMAGETNKLVAWTNDAGQAEGRQPGLGHARPARI